RAGAVQPLPALGIAANLKVPPLAARRVLTAGLGGVRGDELGAGQSGSPFAAKTDQILAVGAIAMKKNDERSCGAAGGGKTGSVQGHDFTPENLRNAEPGRRPRA